MKRRSLLVSISIVLIFIGCGGEESARDAKVYSGYDDDNYGSSYSSDIYSDGSTGLMWQNDYAVGSVTKPWLSESNAYECDDYYSSSYACYDTSGDTAQTYCSRLSLSGYSDWRLPTKRELENVAYNIDDSSYDFYWSSSNYDEYDYLAWTVSFSGLGASWDDKQNYHSVRCVR